MRRDFVVYGSLLAICIAVSSVSCRRAGDGDSGEQTVLVFEVVQDPHFANEPISLANTIDILTQRLRRGRSSLARVEAAGRDRIQVAIPGSDPKQIARVRELVMRGGLLYFRIVANRRDHATLIDKALASQNRALFVNDSALARGKLAAQWAPVAAAGESAVADAAEAAEIAVRKAKLAERDVTEILLVIDELNVSGEFIIEAQPDKDIQGNPCVAVTFNDVGGTLMRELTSANLPAAGGEFTRRLAIVMDHVVQSVPSIQSAIGARAQITGQFSREEVEDLAAILASGAPPYQLREVVSSF